MLNLFYFTILCCLAQIGPIEDPFFKLDTLNTIYSKEGRLIERYTYGRKESWGYQDEPESWKYWEGWDGKSPADSVIWRGKGAVNMNIDKQNLNTFYLVPPKNPTPKSPLCVILHSANLTGFQYLARQHLIESESLPSTQVPDDFYTLYLNSTNKEWWGYREQNVGKPSSAEKRVIDIVKWVIRKYDIDTNRVYLNGPSMGGCGALAIGLSNGDLFAAMRVTVPAGTEYLMNRLGLISEHEGDITNAGNYPFTEVDFSDPPVLVNFSSHNDNWSKTQPALLNLSDWAKIPMVLSWGPFRHNSYDTPIMKYDLCRVALAFPWMDIRKNEAYPVFRNSTVDQKSPWEGEVGKFDDQGQKNAYFRWSNELDNVNSFKMKIWIDHPDIGNSDLIMPENAKTEITIRRLQKFKIEKGNKYEWSLVRNGKTQLTGIITPDDSNLLTIKELDLETIKSELIIKPQ